MISQQKRISTGGQNLDDYSKFIAPDDYVKMLNCINGTSTQRKGTVVQNTLGNRKVNYSLPAGTNEVIGFFEDKKNNSGICLVKNSLGNHSILRYYPSTGNIIKVLEEPLLGFTVPIGSINLVDDLFSFTDGVVPQRSFNITRAQRQDENGAFKNVKFNIYFDFGDFAVGDTYGLQYTDSTGTPITVGVFVSTAAQTVEAGIPDFVTQFNNAQSDFVATSCGQFIEVESTFGGGYDANIFYVANSLKAKRVFTNIYPDAFLETFINADKNPPQCNPTTSFGNDINKKANYTGGRTFQFATAYRYVDNEKSSKGAMSVITAQLHELSNFVKIDFTDTRLSDENLTIIDGVDIFVKEGELGKWQLVKTLDRYEFGITSNYYNFFNDQIYTVIDDAYAIKLFEAIPITSEAQEVAANRMMYGGNKEGYDQVCPEFSLDVTYKPQPKTYTIRFINVIRNIFATTPYYAAITNALPSGNSSYAFVGFEPSPDDLTPNGAALLYQTLPVHGHTFYLAGTDMYGTCKQYISNSGFQQTNGVFNYSTALNWIIGQQQTASGKAQDPFDLGYAAVDQNGNRISELKVGIYSTNLFQICEITGIPEGEYVLRVAGQQTTETDLQDTGYQATSTNVISIGKGSMGGGAIQPLWDNGFEYKFEVGDNVIAYNGVTAINNNNVIYLGCSAIADLSWHYTPTILTGYICDSDLSTSTGTYANLLTDTRIHRAIVNVGYTGFAPQTYNITPATMPSSWSYATYPQLQATTDHNGYFYFAAYRHTSSPFPEIRQIQIGQDLFTPTSAYFSDNTGYTPFTPVTTNGYHTISFKIGSFATPNVGLEKEYDRTFISGHVLLQDLTPVQDASVTNTFGAWQRTDQNGAYQIPVYRDTFKEKMMGISSPPEIIQTRDGFLVYSSLDATYAFDFNYDEFVYSILIDAANYNAATSNSPVDSRYLKILPDNLASLSIISDLISSFKSGNTEFFGIIYYDRENRQTTVLTNPNGEVYFKFYTESPFPTGFPQVGWSISSLPPDWATHYQWVRTHAVPTFLQWTAKSAVPTDINGTPVQFLNAQFIKIDIQGILEYANKFPNSQISYTWEQGDRIRLISDGTNNLTNYIDEEIVKTEVTATNFYIYIEKTNINFTVNVNSLFEIYTPKKANTSSQYWEFGECFETYELNGVKYHKGQSQDQTATQDAEGTFQSGDVYYRFRNYIQGGTKFIEDASVSDFFSSFTTQTGRPQLLDKNAKQVFRPTQIRFSNPYFSGSQQNGFSSFEALNQKEIDRIFGTIQVMRLMAQSVLLTVCQHKTQTFYVNKATINIPSNTPNIISLSDAVLNTADTLIGEWGTQHKLSFDSYNNFAWWYDQSKGVIARYASNGLELPSQYGMKSYFADKGRIPSFARGGYDAYHNIYNITIGNETVGFNDGVEGGKNRWVSFYSYLPECYGSIGTQLLSFLNGELWVHDSLVKNEFYGIKYNSEITVVANDEPSVVKSWQAISEESTDIWEVEMTIQPNVNRPNGQRTVLVRDNFVAKEGVLYSDFKRDINTVNMPSAAEALVNGSRMRGEVAEIKLTNDSTSNVEMFAVNVINIYSPLSDNRRG